MVEPGLGGLLSAHEPAHDRWLSSTRSINTSSLPPEAFWPNSRAESPAFEHHQIVGTQVTSAVVESVVSKFHP
jgi:hypothetical protein